MKDLSFPSTYISFFLCRSESPTKQPRLVILEAGSPRSTRRRCMSPTVMMEASPRRRNAHTVRWLPVLARQPPRPAVRLGHQEQNTRSAPELKPRREGKRLGRWASSPAEQSSDKPSHPGLLLFATCLPWRRRCIRWSGTGTFPPGHWPAPCHTKTTITAKRCAHLPSLLWCVIFQVFISNSLFFWWLDCSSPQITTTVDDIQYHIKNYAPQVSSCPNQDYISAAFFFPNEMFSKKTTQGKYATNARPISVHCTME